MKRMKSGFTLVELLVVIAIIAVLISILLPALNRARAQSRTVQCLTQLQQLGRITSLYAADNKGYLFPCWYSSNTARGATQMTLAGNPGTACILDVYLPPNRTVGITRGLFTCPDSVGDTNQALLTYGCNESVHVVYEYSSANLPKRPLKKASQIHRSAEIFTMADSTQNSGAFTATGYLEYTSDDAVWNPISELDSAANQSVLSDATSGWSNQSDVSGNYHVRYRHGQLRVNPTIYDSVTNKTINYTGTVGLCNFLFLDGHAESLPAATLRSKNIATWY